MGGLTRALFLDRDGVINDNRDDYVKSWDEFVFLPRVFEALRLFAGMFPRIIVITNQAAVAKGQLSHVAARDILTRMKTEVEREGGRIDGLYYCPHASTDGCDCRKPKPGLLLRAAQDHEVDLRRSFLVGDKISDVQAALSVGASPIFVLTGEGQKHQQYIQESAYACVPVVSDLYDVALHLSRANFGATINDEADPNSEPRDSLPRGP